jgi:hypothetical protein
LIQYSIFLLFQNTWSPWVSRSFTKCKSSCFFIEIIAHFKIFSLLILDQYLILKQRPII